MKKTLKQLWSINHIVTHYLRPEWTHQLVMNFSLVLALAKHKGIELDPLEIFDLMVAELLHTMHHIRNQPDLHQMALVSFTEACIARFCDIPQSAIAEALDALTKATTNESVP